MRIIKILVFVICFMPCFSACGSIEIVEVPGKGVIEMRPGESTEEPPTEVPSILDFTHWTDIFHIDLDVMRVQYSGFMLRGSRTGTIIIERALNAETNNCEHMLFLLDGQTQLGNVQFSTNGAYAPLIGLQCVDLDLDGTDEILLNIHWGTSETIDTRIFSYDGAVIRECFSIFSTIHPISAGRRLNVQTVYNCIGCRPIKSTDGTFSLQIASTYQNVGYQLNEYRYDGSAWTQTNDSQFVYESDETDRLLNLLEHEQIELALPALFPDYFGRNANLNGTGDFDGFIYFHTFHTQHGEGFLIEASMSGGRTAYSEFFPISVEADRFGDAYCSIGDIDQDGLSEIIVFVANDGQGYSVYAYKAMTGAITETFRIAVKGEHDDPVLPMPANKHIIGGGVARVKDREALAICFNDDTTSWVEWDGAEWVLR